MKKTLLIGTIVVLVLALAGGVIAFAAWDIPNANINLTVNNVASNVIVTATVTPDSADKTKNLIPSVAKIIGANDVTNIKAGSFNVQLSSDNTAAALSDLINKVDVTYNVNKVTFGDSIANADTAFKSGEWSKYVVVTVCSKDNPESVVLDKLTIKNDTLGTDFFVYIAFQNFKNVTDEAEQAYIRSLSGKVFKIDMDINIASKTSVTA